MRRGLTLIELIVAVTIGALVAVSVVSATTTMTRARQSVSERTRRLAAARRAMAVIAGDLRNVRRDPIRERPIIVGTSSGRGRGQDSIDLLVILDRPSRPDGSESDQQEVSYYLLQRTGEVFPSLIRRQDHELDDEPIDGGVATVVADGIIGLRFEFLTEREWIAEWPPSQTRAPDAVRVTVAAAATDRPTAGQPPEIVVFSTVVAIKSAPPVNPPGRESGNEQERGRG